jgi:uncharacterized protein DUF4145
MPQLSLACPHCLTGRIGFAPRGSALVKPGRREHIIFLQCEGCGEGVIAEVLAEQHSQQPTMWMQGATDTPGRILKVYPELTALQAPADTPDQICNAFLSGLDNLYRTNGANASAMMFRRAIELAAKRLNPDGTGNLRKRIADLPDNYVTPTMKDWADHIRLEGNDAAHEEGEYSEDDAKALHTFAEMFLTYAFTLPKMLERAKAEAEKSPSKIRKKDGNIATE